MRTAGLSIIVPTYNEAGNIRSLIYRVERAMESFDITYEIIFVDDHSTDSTRRKIKNYLVKNTVKLFIKEGKKGKGYSIVQGASHAQYDYIAMLDADLQYPPEIIPQLYAQAKEHGFAVATRKTYKSTLLRTVASRLNAFVFGKLLLNLNTDVQSGLKIFHSEVFEHLDPRLVSSWAIDIPLIHMAYELGGKPGHVDIDFHPRLQGESKIHFLSTSYEIAYGAIKTRMLRRPLLISPQEKDTMLGSGLTYKRKRFITHTTLSHRESALVTFTFWQQVILFSLIAALIIGLMINPLITAITAVAVLSAIYFIDVLFNLYVILKSLHFPPEIKITDEEINQLDVSALPTYSILCPLYHEASILPQFVDAVKALDWPKEKLDVLLLLEEDDTLTVEEANKLHLPSYIRVVIVPQSEPKTKPKASNYGLSQAKGEYVVVFDAEDKPDPDQLKKAYIAFAKADANVICLQAKLNYYNPRHNLLTRLFTAEYSLWFDVILPGLQSINTSIPLGGTSNHFRRSGLIELQGWDPFNVTEDCDLGARLFKKGYKTAIIDSTTLEEANSRVHNWFRQRSRWIKGYIQTYLVHMRNPVQFARDYGYHALIFQLVVGGKIAFMLINPILWIITISYFVLYRFVGPTIEAVYPTSIFYMAAFSLVLGNFICLYNYMIGCAKRDHWDLVKYIFFIPFYWLMISIGAGIATFQLFFKPHYWEKTIHGLHLQNEIALQERSALKLQTQNARAQRIRKLIDLASSDWARGGLLIGATMFANFFNFLYNTYLGRTINVEEFGLIGLIGSFTYISQIPLAAVSGTATFRSAYFLGKYEAPIKQYWAYLRRQTMPFAIAVTLIWLIFLTQFSRAFHIPSIVPLLIVTPLWIASLGVSLNSGFLKGNLKFEFLSLLIVLESIVKFTITILFVHFGLTDYVYSAIPLSLMASFAVGTWLINIFKVKPVDVEKKILHYFPKRYFGTSIITSLAITAFLTFDMLLVKIFLSPTAAGEYALLSLVGKMIYFVGALFSQFITPMVSKEEGAGRDSEPVFYKLIGATTFVCIAGYLGVGVFGKFTLGLLFGAKIAPVIPYFAEYALAMACFTIASSVIAYHQVKREYLFAGASFLLTFTEVVGIMLFHESLASVIHVMFISGIGLLAMVIILHFKYKSLRLFLENAADFYGLFHRLPTPARLADGNLRILIFNWRDTKHSWAGGAEEYIHQLAKRWVAMGHEVTVFSGNDGKSPRHETLDGVQIIRRGGTYFVYVWAFLYYKFKLQNKYDIIIDSENGIPFFSPLYTKEKTFLLIHHVHQEVFRRSLRPPLSWIGILLERRLMPIVYRNTEVITVSPSSKADILRHKLTQKDPHVVYNGVNLKEYAPGIRSKTPVVLYLGRLTTMKSLDIFIYSAKKVLEKMPKVRFVIAGDGPSMSKLVKLVKIMKLGRNIHFTGRVSETEKVALYQKAWVFVNPSLIEGWGITTIEANACGTPVVASNVPGLRDAVHNPHSGFLVPYGNAEEFASYITMLLADNKLRTTMSEEATDWAKKFSWDNSADLFASILTNQVALEGDTDMPTDIVPDVTAYESST